jgi:hypothetical protein
VFAFGPAAAAVPAPVAAPVRNGPTAPASVRVPPAVAPAVPMAQAVASVPLARPVTPVEDTSDNPFTSPTPVVPRRTKGRKPSSGGRPLVLIGILVVAVAGLAVGAYFIWKQTENVEAPGDFHESKMYNYRFALPRKDWQDDKKAKLDLDANLALHRADPNSWLAIITRDYKKRSPRPAELQDEIRGRLEKYFQELEWEEKPDAKLAGQTAKQLEFAGLVNQVRMSGTVLMLTRHGYGYWVLTWAPDERREIVEDEWANLRQGFSLLNGRDGWKEEQPKLIHYKGTKAPYRLNYTQGLWERQELDGYGEYADLVLLGDDPKQDKKTGNAGLAGTRGTVKVLKLPGKTTDLKAAAAQTRAFLMERQKEDGYADTKITVVEDKNGPKDGPADIGAGRDSAHGWMARLDVRNTDSRELYVQLATVLLPDGILLIQCECQWQRRGYWEQEFAVLLSTFRLEKGK